MRDVTWARRGLVLQRGEGSLVVTWVGMGGVAACPPALPGGGPGPSPGPLAQARPLLGLRLGLHLALPWTPCIPPNGIWRISIDPSAPPRVLAPFSQGVGESQEPVRGAPEWAPPPGETLLPMNPGGLAHRSKGQRLRWRLYRRDSQLRDTAACRPAPPLPGAEGSWPWRGGSGQGLPP